MKHIIKDYRSITDDHMRLIRKQYPNGFTDADLITLKTADGDYIDALEVKTNDAVYLVRVNHNLLDAIDQFEDGIWEDKSQNQLEEIDD